MIELVVNVLLYLSCVRNAMFFKEEITYSCTDTIISNITNHTAEVDGMRGDTRCGPGP